MTNIARVVLPLMAAWLGLTASGFAADDQWRPDPPGTWRHVDTETASSQCIGRPDTPHCAVDTLMACGVRDADELCQTASLNGRMFGSSSGGAGWVRYHIARISVVPEDQELDPAHYVTDPLELAKAGDLKLDIESYSCKRGATCQDHIPRKLRDIVYLVRRTGDRWAVVNYYVPRPGEPFGPIPVIKRSTESVGDLAKPDPPGRWRMIGYSAATSPCIGQLTTPVCAVETLMACETQSNGELCRKARITGFPHFYYKAKDPNEGAFKGAPEPVTGSTKYRIRRVWEATDIKAVPTLGADDPAPMEIGDTLVEVEKTEYYGVNRSVFGGIDRDVYATRKVGDEWKVVGWARKSR